MKQKTVNYLTSENTKTVVIKREDELRMKKKVIKGIACAGIMALSVMFTGCNPKEDEKTAACLVIANTANSQGLNVNGSKVDDTLNEVVKNYGLLGVVNADGKPDVKISDFNIPDNQKNASQAKLDKEAEKNINNVKAYLSTVVADNPEVDYLESLRLASRTLNALSDDYDKKEILVIGSGLSTTGVLDFNNNLICADSKELAEILAEKSEIPELSGITVYWQQLGDVEAPQKALTGAQVKNLENIYRDIVETGGGKFVCLTEVAGSKNENVEYPFVTAVDLPEEDPVEFEPADIAKTSFDKPVVISEEQVAFIGDMAEYINPEAANETLKPIAEYLISNPDIKLLMAGTTAGDIDTEKTVKLSRERAERVKKSLVEYGVEEDRLITVGLGSTKDPWHINNAGYEGKGAACNRKVVLLDAGSSIAKKIINI